MMKLKRFVIAVIFTAISTVIFGGCGIKSVDMSNCSQPYSYFPEGEERFILVDESIQKIGNETLNCAVFADKYMGTMYLRMVDTTGGYSYMTQIFYEDGSPIIYDEDYVE